MRRCYQPPTSQDTLGSQLGCVVVLVSKQYTYTVRRYLYQQLLSFLSIVMISRSKLDSKRYPDGSSHRYQMKFPPVHPPMPTTLGPVSFGVNI